MAKDAGDPAGLMGRVRHELKKWEWQFRQATGRKPRREDVKSDAVISAKYEEYDRLSGRIVKERPTRQAEPNGEGRDERVLKERPTNVVSATPKKNFKHSECIEAPDDVIVQEPEPTPACVRFALGPTPQKDGAVLGLFDMLPAGTPTKGADTSLKAAVVGSDIVSATPSKSTTLSSSTWKVSKTPQSSAKRTYLDAFGGTPLKRKREDETFTPSTSRKQYATPAFLRRTQSLAAIEEDTHEARGVGRPFKKRGLVRSLSTIIQGLKKQEDDRMDDEWDVLNEIEAEQRGETTSVSVPKALVENDGEVDMPLGPDQGIQSDRDAEEDGANKLDGMGKPRKAWKKKGLKRQTRRVIMRPVMHKPEKSVDAACSDDEENQFGHATKTRLAGAGQRAGKSHDDEKYDTDDDENDAACDPINQSNNDEGLGESSATSKTKNATVEEDNVTSKKRKKVSAQAHANFRKLKIKNKNSKANGRGGKFRKR